MLKGLDKVHVLCGWMIGTPQCSYSAHYKEPSTVGYLYGKQLMQQKHHCLVIYFDNLSCS